MLKGLELPKPGKRKGDYEEFYELTIDGEAINLNEYCAWIADTRYENAFSEWTKDPTAKRKDPFSSKTHVIQLTNYDSKQNDMLQCFVKSGKEEFLKLEGLDGKLDPTRPSRSHTIFYPFINLGNLRRHLLLQREIGNLIFYFPNSTKSIGAIRSDTKWPEESHQEVVFDLRKDSNVVGHDSSFKTEINPSWEGIISQPQLKFDLKTQHG